MSFFIARENDLAESQPEKVKGLTTLYKNWRVEMDSETEALLGKTETKTK